MNENSCLWCGQDCKSYQHFCSAKCRKASLRSTNELQLATNKLNNDKFMQDILKICNKHEAILNSVAIDTNKYVLTIDYTK